jgi:hypothetical protein
MSFIAVAIGGSALLGAGSSIYGALTQSGAEKQAAGTIAGAEQAGIGAETGFVNQGTSSIMSLLGPYLNAGTGGGGGGALATLQSLLTPGANMTQVLSQIPGLQFLQNWGQQGVSAQATTRGLGGNAIAAGDQFATGTALSSGFSPIISALQSLINTGAGSAATGATSIGGLLGGAGQTISSLITGAGSNIAQTQIGGANALSAGATGVSNAATGAVGGLTNLGILNALTGGQFGGGMFGGGQNSTGGTGGTNPPPIADNPTYTYGTGA